MADRSGTVVEETAVGGAGGVGAARRGSRGRHGIEREPGFAQPGFVFAHGIGKTPVMLGQTVHAAQRTARGIRPGGLQGGIEFVHQAKELADVPLRIVLLPGRFGGGAVSRRGFGGARGGGSHAAGAGFGQRGAPGSRKSLHVLKAAFGRFLQGLCQDLLESGRKIGVDVQQPFRSQLRDPLRNKCAAERMNARHQLERHNGYRE